MSDNQFKPHDKVRWIEKGDKWIDVGATATVINQDKEFVTIRWDVDHPCWHGRPNGGYYPKSFELCELLEDPQDVAETADYCSCGSGYKRVNVFILNKVSLVCKNCIKVVK